MLHSVSESQFDLIALASSSIINSQSILSFTIIANSTDDKALNYLPNSCSITFNPASLGSCEKLIISASKRLLHSSELLLSPASHPLSFQTKPYCWGNHSELDIYFILFPHLKSSTIPNSLYLNSSSYLAGYMFSTLSCGIQLPQSTPHPHTGRSMCHHFKTRQYSTFHHLCGNSQFMTFPKKFISTPVPVLLLIYGALF